MRDETDSDTRHGAPTRRECMKYGGAVISGGLLAGCAGGSDETESAPTTATARTEPKRRTGATERVTEAETAAAEAETYSVTLAPAGTVEFERPPENVYTDLTHHAGMALALGHGDAINATWGGERYGPIWNSYLERLPGVSVDWAGLPNSFNPDKELLYELDSDLHLADPAYVTWMEKLDDADVEEIGENVAPFFGNTFSNSHGTPPEEWADAYEYYTLWEIFERVAAVFRAEDRYEALAAIRDEIRATVESNLPPENERPTAAIVQPYDGAFWVYHLNAPGFLYAHTRPLGAVDAFEGVIEGSGQIDYEQLLERDPEVLLVTGMMGQSGIEDIRRTLADDPVGEQLTAVENERVYAGGVRNQGPLLNLFQLEMTAKQLYPDRFGAWPTYTGGPYPEIPEEEQLFDRRKIAGIVNGGL